MNSGSPFSISNLISLPQASPCYSSVTAPPGSPDGPSGDPAGAPQELDPSTPVRLRPQESGDPDFGFLRPLDAHSQPILFPAVSFKVIIL